MKYISKGQSLLGVVMWASGISLTALGLGSAILVPKINAQDEKIYDQRARLSAVETEIKRLPIIEEKLDRLLLKQGIDPNKK